MPKLHANREPLRDHLLWTDLETAGSSETEGDEIIEIGCVLTTYDLEEVSSYTSLVRPSPLALGRLLQNEVVRKMHTTNGLLDDVLDLSSAETFKPHYVTRELLTWLGKSGAQKGKTAIAGSGVGHFDSRFIRKYMPQLMPDFCHYWVIDIGNIRRAWDMWVGTDVSAANDNKTHRALDDARCH